MLGAIAGDVIGSPYEWHPTKSKDFPLVSPRSRFTDDTVLTIAVAEALLTDGDYTRAIKSFGRKYPDAGYGKRFLRWLAAEASDPYNSFGNGSAMRVAPIAWVFDSVEDVLGEAERSAAVTHNHPEGVKGAKAAALAVFLARQGLKKDAIAAELTNHFGYDLSRTPDEIRPGYSFDVTCQGSVPESIVCFLEADSFEDAVRTAISLGGDADTMAAIAGSIAEPYFGGMPEDIDKAVRSRLPSEFLDVLERFQQSFPPLQLQ